MTLNAKEIDVETVGRRDWDYVAFGDYASDMRESAEQGAAAVRFVKEREQSALRRASFLELALADALKQLGPGATAVVHDHLIHKMPEAKGPDLIFERCEYDQTYRVRAA